MPGRRDGRSAGDRTHRRAENGCPGWRDRDLGDLESRPLPTIQVGHLGDQREHRRPGAGDHGRDTRRPQVARPARADAGIAAARYCWCSRSTVAGSSRLGSSVIACTSRAAVAAFAAASACGTAAGNKPAGVVRRAGLVGAEHHRADAGCTSRRTATGRPFGPRYGEGEAAEQRGGNVVGMALHLGGQGQQRRRRPRRPRARAARAPASRPATMAAADEPSPPPCGITFSQHRCTAGQRHARAIGDAGASPARRDDRRCAAPRPARAPTPRTSIAQPIARCGRPTPRRSARGRGRSCRSRARGWPTWPAPAR